MVKNKKISIYDIESRRVTGDRNFLVEWSNEKKIPKNNFKLFNDENNSENAWLVNIYDSMDFIIAVNTSKVLISTSNLTTDDFPQKFNSEFYNPQKQVRAYILEWFFIHYYLFILCLIKIDNWRIHHKNL